MKFEEKTKLSQSMENADKPDALLYTWKWYTNAKGANKTDILKTG